MDQQAAITDRLKMSEFTVKFLVVVGDDKMSSECKPINTVEVVYFKCLNLLIS